MKLKPMKISNLIGIFALLVVPGIHAQVLSDGAWTGTRTSPTDTASIINVEMRVTNRPNGAIAIYVNHILGMSQAKDVSIESGELRYHFEVPGRDVISECVLKPIEDGAYSGSCFGDNGAEFLYTYQPPGN